MDKYPKEIWLWVDPNNLSHHVTGFFQTLGEDVRYVRADEHARGEREKVGAWMIHNGYSTGHGDTIEELLEELKDQLKKSPHDEG